ncbi:MAG: cupin-like domain-containing protein [Myxococcota bacterium]
MSPLPEQWAVWIAGNLVRGRPIPELVAALVDDGLAPELAAAEVEALDRSPGVVGARLALRPVVEVHRLRLAKLRLGGREVPVLRGRDPTTFHEAYVAPHRPVKLPDLTEDWPARSWTWSALDQRWGQREVDVCDGRSAVAQPARRWQGLVRRRRLSEVIARALDPSTGDDLYVTANNAALEGPLAPMLDDVRPVPGILVAGRLRESSVWLGPAGTRTPIHHDTSDTLLCQFLGHKRVWLAPPEETELAERGAGYFGPDLSLSDADDLARIGIGDAAIHEVAVGPGDALLIPAGWWHEVVSESPSLTLTFVGLAHRNDYRWFRPAPPDDGAP